MKRHRFLLGELLVIMAVIPVDVAILAFIADLDRLADPVDPEVITTYRSGVIIISVLLVLAASVLWIAWSRRAPADAPDLPARILGLAVAAMPAARREWGLAMLAELDQVGDPGARWWFAVSAARAALFAPRADRRSRRPPAGWAHAAIGTGCIFAAGGATAWFLITRPSTVVEEPTTTALLIMAIGICGWLMIATPRPLLGDPDAHWVGAGTGLSIAAGLFVAARTLGNGDGPGAAVILLIPVALAVTPAIVAGVRRSFWAGVRTAVMTAAFGVPATIAIYLPESAAYADRFGVSFLDNESVPVSDTIGSAFGWIVMFTAVIALPLGILTSAIAVGLASIGRTSPPVGRYSAQFGFGRP